MWETWVRSLGLEDPLEKGMTEDEMVGWHHRIDGCEFEQAPGVGDGQGSLACCSPWGRKESDTTEQLNWTELIRISPPFWTSLPSLSLSHPSRLIRSPCLSFLSHTANSCWLIYFTYGNVSFHVTLSLHLTLSSPLPMSISLFSLFLHWNYLILEYKK